MPNSPNQSSKPPGWIVWIVQKIFLSKSNQTFRNLQIWCSFFFYCVKSQTTQLLLQLVKTWCTKYISFYFDDKVPSYQFIWQLLPQYDLPWINAKQNDDHRQINLIFLLCYQLLSFMFNNESILSQHASSFS